MLIVELKTFFFPLNEENKPGEVFNLQYFGLMTLLYINF